MTKSASICNTATRFAAPLATMFLLLLSSCAGDGGSPPPDANVVHAEVCKSGDELVAGPEMCLQDDAACYQIATGDWCTGERGNRCPAGSAALPAGSTCPPGKRCIRIGESLECQVGD
ncbi:MAG: hypothetical protein CSB44_10760 [Gammaproteobacteria bacterium]|nr:MAG: hypothetical protein CSB44_10760 [Gammaproteobacteria bacterium]PIE36437.1 MAG: hypothetical protein CSA54_04405 [Gammaproteobacteria bacterium]